MEVSPGAGSAWCWVVGRATPAVPLGGDRVGNGAGVSGRGQSWHWQCPGPEGWGPRPRWHRGWERQAPPRPAGPCVALRRFLALVPSGPWQRRRGWGLAGAHKEGEGLAVASAPSLSMQLPAEAGLPCPSSWELS